MHNASVFFLFFLIFAALSAAFHCYLHKVIGAPRIDKDDIASVTRGMIGSFIGIWLARSYNAAVMRHKERVRTAALQSIADDPAALLIEAQTYAKDAGDYPPQALDEVAIEYVIEGRAHNTMPLFWQKAAGLCSACTAFWVHSAVYWGLIVAGAFPETGAGVTLIAWALFPSSAFFIQQAMISPLGQH